MTLYDWVCVSFAVVWILTAWALISAIGYYGPRKRVF